MLIRLAQPADVRAVSRVLNAANDHVVASGLTQWDASYLSEAALAPQVAAGRYYIGFEGEDALAVFRLENIDLDFWPEMAEGSANYLHRLAIEPRVKGTGVAQEMLRHAVNVTRRQGLRYLRLDCMGGRPGLRQVYLDFGFGHHSDKPLGGHVFHRFELDVDAGSSPA